MRLVATLLRGAFWFVLCVCIVHWSCVFCDYIPHLHSVFLYCICVFVLHLCFCIASVFLYCICVFVLHLCFCIASVFLYCICVFVLHLCFALSLCFSVLHLCPAFSCCIPRNTVVVFPLRFL